MRKKDHTKPPRWASTFLRNYCRDEFREEIEGDVYELFEARLVNLGSRKAGLLFIWDVIRFFRWSNIKKVKFLNLSQPMVKNNLTVALRVLRRQRMASFINTLSLTLGITAVTLIYFFINEEFSYDQFHSKNEQIYRLVKDNYESENEIRSTSGYHPLPLSEKLVEDLPEVMAATRISHNEYYMRLDGKMQEESIFFADPNLLTTFDFPMIRGDKSSVLSNQGSVVLTERAANRLFNTIDVIGKSIEFRIGRGGFKEFLVTGVAENVPSNSTIQFDILLPYTDAAHYARFKDYWRINTDETYLLLNPAVDRTNFDEKLEMQWTNYMPHKVADMEENGFAPFKYRLQPLSEVHLNTEISGLSEASDPMYSYILGIIGSVILLIGCANFMILSIGRSASRAKEIAIRKVVGAGKKQLIFQFWSEAFVLSIISAALAVGLVYLLLPTFNELADKRIEFAAMVNLQNVAVLTCLTFFAGIMAGLYPAIILSGLKSLDVFRRKVKLGGANLFTKSLVTFQFALSIVLVLGTLIIYQQVDFLKNKDLGFDGKDVIVLKNRLSGKASAQKELKDQLAANPNVLSFAEVSSSFTNGRFQSSYETENGKEIPYFMYRISTNYLSLLEIEILEGRDFDGKLATDTLDAVVVNKAFIRELGPDFKLGDRIENFDNADLKSPRVVGIVEDYNFESLDIELKPVLLSIQRFSGFQDLLIKTAPGKSGEVLSSLESSWYEMASSIPFSYSFLEDDLEAQYAKEQRWASIIQYAAVWAVLLAVLGLMGLVALSIAGRIKEFGVRKVLGASTWHLYRIIVKQYAIWLTVALAIALPVAVYVMKQWLSDFAYHINISPLLLAVGIAILFGLVLLVLAINALNAGKRSTMEALRLE
ncbi:MAG: FtsX-like permease family protein [Roseivirga sp.]|nr:FtsX-like permease family protein [Roseivirga sp.]